jgi:aerobic carbon-monoxide dehydrogenase large subunit
LKRPGIVAAFTGEALAAEWAVGIHCGWPVTEYTKTPGHWPLARNEVNHEGDGMILVVATDHYKAQDAPGLVEVD